MKGLKYRGKPISSTLLLLFELCKEVLDCIHSILPLVPIECHPRRRSGREYTLKKASTMDTTHTHTYTGVQTGFSMTELAKFICPLCERRWIVKMKGRWICIV